MKTLKQGVGRSAHVFVPKIFNSLMILGLILQPVGPAGVYSIALATESDSITPNPTLSQACGLDIALVIDNSTSIDNGELSQMKSAMTGFTDALAGTPTEFSVTKFSRTGSVAQLFTANITDVNNAIDGIPNNVPTSDTIGTNWQDGLTDAQSTLPNRSNPNLVIFASDGNPNRTGASGTSVTEAQAVSDAVTVANSIKTSGARIIVLGIGDELNVNNLKTISGSNVGTDLSADVITGDFSTLASILAAFASETCGGTITANKFIDNLNTPAGTGWTFNIAGQGKSTDDNGQTAAVEVNAGIYSVTETGLVSGYSFSSAVCQTQAGTPVGYATTNGVRSISVGNSDIISCNFINHFNPPTLQISKTNDSGAPETPGNDVLYTITVTAPDSNTTDVKDVKVTDLPPAGFIYRGSSSTANSNNGSHIGLLELTHTYASPGIWSLGTMKPGEVITLTYIADISSSQDAGKYNDLAFAKGKSVVDADVTANDPTPFVGTDVDVVLPNTPANVALTNTTERNVDHKTVTKVKRVLGAATVLPMTGVSVNTILFALMLLLGGLVLILLSKKSTWLRIRSISKSMMKVFLFAVVGGIFLTSYAAHASVSNLNVEIETPKTQVSDPNFKIGFVVLDIDNDTPTVTCEVDDGGGFVDFPAAHIEYVAQAGGNSGNCVVDALVMTANGTYKFRVTADSVQSDEVSVTLVFGTPSTPLNYSRTSCTVNFTTADDGLTDTVELYRSLSSTFTADASTLVATSASIGPNFASTLTDPNGNCGGSYFYAIRAVALSGNGSGFVGDENVVIDNENKITHKTKTKKIAGPTTTLAAIPVTGGGTPAGAVEGATTGGEEVTPPTAEPKEGSVLGEATKVEAIPAGVWSWIKNHPWKSLSWFIVLFLIAYLAYWWTYLKSDENDQIR